MELQFTFLSYIVMAVFYSFAVVILYVIWKITKTKPLIIFLSVVTAILPWADEVWISYHFNDACKDAGIHVYRVDEVDGFF